MRKSHLLIASAWLIHAVAWFLPVLKGSEKVRGWEAFRMAALMLWLSIDLHRNWYFAMLATLSALTTILFVFGSPLVVWRGSRSFCRASAWVAAGAFVVNAHWYVLYSRSGLWIGYYAWWLSFALLAIALFDLAGENQAKESARGQRTGGL